MTQFVINIGALPNDGTGDPLRTAFNETNLNFDQVFAAGPVLSNVQIANNTILTTNTNGNLVLAPNGIGVVQANVNIVPNTSNIRNLGAADRRWSTVYVQYANVSGGLAVANLTATGNVTVGGNLSVTGNIIYIGNLITDAKTIQLANTAGTANAANGSGITVGANDNIATFLFDSATNTWNTNIGLAVNGNITGTGLAVSDATVYGNVNAINGNFTGNIVVNTVQVGTIQLNPVGGPNTLSNITVVDDTVFEGNVDVDGTLFVMGNVSADYFIGDGSQLTGLPPSYANANAVAYGESGWAGNIVPSGNAVYSLGNATNQWNDLYVSNATIFMNNVPISLSAGNVLTVNGNAVLQNNSNSTISTTGNITAGNLVTGGTVSATGNISGGFIFGNISQANGFPATYGNANVANYLPTFSGNISAGNVNVTGNVSGAYVKGNGSELTNLPAPTVAQDITSNGAMSIMTYDGNIKYVSYATVEPASGNITGGNILTGGLVSATGNVTGGNLIATGNIVLTGSLVGSGASPAPSLSGFSSVSAITVSASGNISATGNVTGNYFIGNGSQLTGIAASYGNSNVVTLLAAYGSNTISTTGNITAGNLIGNISITGNVTGTSANVTLVAGSYSTVFDNTGNTAFANGTVSLTTLSATGNITGGNIITAGNVSGNTAGFAIGYRDIPQVSFTGNATIATTDAGKHFYSTQSSNFTLTIANNASQGFQVGAAITVVNQGTGTISIAQGSGVTLYLAGNATAGNRSVATFGMATLIKVATDTWFINGTGVS
jgi:hypothetical protein